MRDSSSRWLPNDRVPRVFDIRLVYSAAIDERELMYARGGQKAGDNGLRNASIVSVKILSTTTYEVSRWINWRYVATIMTNCNAPVLPPNRLPSRTFIKFMILAYSFVNRY